ncbi:MAG TPA: hypothetical protein VNZ61_06630 [Roseomonas sp.]|nr:hypothetical protein [Roseomonas sp.]
MSESRRTSTERNTGRGEAFSDGVFAIAITLLTWRSGSRIRQAPRPSIC